MFMIPLLVSLLVTAGLILAGFLLHVLVHFRSLHLRLLWLVGSLAAGILCYRLFRRFHPHARSIKSNQNEGRQTS